MDDLVHRTSLEPARKIGNRREKSTVFRLDQMSLDSDASSLPCLALVWPDHTTAGTEYLAIIAAQPQGAAVCRHCTSNPMQVGAEEIVKLPRPGFGSRQKFAEGVIKMQRDSEHATRSVRKTPAASWNADNSIAF